MRRMLTALSTLITVTLITATGAAFAAEPQVRRETMLPREQRSERAVSKPFLIPVATVGAAKVLLDMDPATLQDPNVDIWVQLWIRYPLNYIQDEEPTITDGVRFWMRPGTGEVFSRDSMNKSWHDVYVDGECAVIGGKQLPVAVGGAVVLKESRRGIPYNAEDARQCMDGLWRFSAGARYIGGNHTKDGKPVIEQPGFVMHAGMTEHLRGRQVRVQIIPPDDSHPAKWSREHTVFKKPLNAGAVIEVRE